MRCLVLFAVFFITTQTSAEAGPFRRYQRSSNSSPTVQSPVQATPVQSQYYPASGMSGTGGVTMASATLNATSNQITNGMDDALGEVNAKRAERGLRPFLPDPALNQAARACAEVRASRRIAGHLANDFSYVPAGTTASSAGCGALEPSWGWGTCCTYENYTYAGAAWVMGADGRRYMHLFVR